MFEKLLERVDELDELGSKYLDKLPFMSNDDVADRIYKKAIEIFEDNNEDWSKIPEWISHIVEGYIPYYTQNKNGSLHHLLGQSCVSRDAHLRNILEVIEGREKDFLDFPVIAELELI